jgi:hypothetical protein
MTPRRTEIRNAFKAAITGLATTGANVFLAPRRQLAANELPALLLWSGEESPDGAFLRNGLPLQTRWRLVVGIRVKEDDAETTADDIIGEIKAALFASPAAMTLGGLVKSLSYAGAGEVELDEAQDKAVLALPVFFDCSYS